MDVIYSQARRQAQAVGRALQLLWGGTVGGGLGFLPPKILYFLDAISCILTKLCRVSAQYWNHTFVSKYRAILYFKGHTFFHNLTYEIISEILLATSTCYSCKLKLNWITGRPVSTEWVLAFYLSHFINISSTFEKKIKVKTIHQSLGLCGQASLCIYSR